MKVDITSDIDLSRFKGDASNLDALYGLPKNVKFCKRCNMSNQQPMSSNEYKHGKHSSKTTTFKTESITSLPVFAP